MNIIIIGCGKVGSKFAKLLVKEGHDVVIVDNDSDALRAMSATFRGMVIHGVPIDQDVLKQAGIENADALAAVTPDDNINIMVCQVAKEIFKVPKVIARIYNPNREHIFHHFGLDTICPTDLTVDVIRAMLLGSDTRSNLNIGKFKFVFRQEELPQNMENKKLSNIKLDVNSMIFGIIRDGQFYYAYPSLRFVKGDMLVIADK